MVLDPSQSVSLAQDDDRDPLELEDMLESGEEESSPDLLAPAEDEHAIDPALADVTVEHELVKEIDAVTKDAEKDANPKTKSHMLPSHLINAPLQPEDWYDKDLL